DEEDRDDLDHRRDLPGPARREALLPGGQDQEEADEQDEEVAGEDHDGQPDRNLRRRRVRGNGEEEGGGHEEQLVGDGVGGGARGRLQVEVRGQEAVDPAREARRDEDREGDSEATVGDANQEEREGGEANEGDEVGQSPGTRQRRLHSFSRAPGGTSAGTQTVDPLMRMSLRSSNCLSIRVTVSRGAPIELAISWCVGRWTA